MRVFIFLYCSLFWIGNAHAQGNVNWMTIEEALEASETEKRKIVVDIYTDWCGWCKKMEKATFQTPHIADYLNTNYYPVKFNAEQKTDIIYKGKTYKYVKTSKRGYHELAAKITGGRLSYPTVVFLDEEQNIIQPIPGFQDVTTFEMIMSYFADDHYKDTPWKKYTLNYISPTTNPIQPTKEVLPASARGN